MSFLKDPIGNISGAIHDVGKSSIGKMAEAAALAYFLGPAGEGLMGADTALGVGGGLTTLLNGGNLQDSIKSGVMAYGIGQLTGAGQAIGDTAIPGGAPVEERIPTQVGEPPVVAQTAATAPLASQTSFSPPAGPPISSEDWAMNAKYGDMTAAPPPASPNVVANSIPAAPSIADQNAAQAFNETSPGYGNKGPNAPITPSGFKFPTSWADLKELYKNASPYEVAGAGALGIAALKAAAKPNSVSAAKIPTQYINRYNYNPYTQQMSIASRTPACQYNGATGGLVALAGGGSIKHYDGTDGSVVTSSAPAYTSYTPDQVTNYIQTSGIDLSNPNAVNAALSQAHMDPAAYASYLTSANNPFAVKTLENPTAASVASFDKSLGATPSPDALTDIRNAVVTAQNTVGGPNSAANMPANTQIAKEMDAFHVDPGTMGTAVGMTKDQIQAIYNQVNPCGPYSTVKKGIASLQPGTQYTGTGTGNTIITPTDVTPINTAPSTTLAGGVGGNTGAGQVGGGTVINPNGTITSSPRIPGIPVGGFTGMTQLKDAYTKGGGSLGYTNPAPASMDEFNKEFNTMKGGSAAAYDFLTGKTTQPKIPYTSTGQIAIPYATSVMGSTAYVKDPSGHYVLGQVTPTDKTGNPITDAKGLPVTAHLDPASGYYVYNGTYYDQSGRAAANTSTTITTQSGEKATLDPALNLYVDSKGNQYNVDGTPYAPGTAAKAGGLMGVHMAMGGMTVGHLGGYSDGGRLLRGPGDGVSDSIPATIGTHEPEPARLADGEFVVPARIVSELGNGSTEAGARQLYKMMSRIQHARSKTTGKDAVANNTNSAQYLPA